MYTYPGGGMSAAGMPSSGNVPGLASPPHHHQPQQQQYPSQYPQHGPGLQPQPQFDTSAMKLTRGTSCVLCQQRKVRCDKNKPCANCVKAKVECKVIPPQPPRRRKKRLQERDLIDRLKKYESLLSENGVKFDPLGQELQTDGPQGEDMDELDNDFETLNTSVEAGLSPLAASKGGKPREKPSSSLFALHAGFRASDKLIQDSSDEEEEGGSNIHRAFDKLFSNEDGFPFLVGGSFVLVTHSHPNPIQIFQLWQVYIDNINSILKMTHIPTIQPQILEAASHLEKTPKNIEALMFGIYLMAITSMEEKEVQRLFNQSKQSLLTRFLSATQQALINASFMKVDDLIVLQAFVLYLFAVRWFIDPRQVFCLLGMAVRLAQRMGLHKDPGGYGLPPFEVEQRRRLWWVIVNYDRRMGEMTGSTVTAISSGGDCKLPLNVNDSDLHIEGKEMPTPHNGPTEMLFALARIEVSIAVASNSNRDSERIHSPDTRGGSPASSSGAASKAGQPTIRLASPDSPTWSLDGFCAHIEGTYLIHCDPKIPLHFFALTMTRQALCKMRVVNFLVRMAKSDHIPLKEIERESLFLQATQMIEYDNVVQSSESLVPFKWYSRHHFPFPAYMFLVQELRTRVAGPMVERAWDAIASNHELRGLLNNFHSPMHMAFKNTFIKAWDAHEAAQRAAGKNVPEPRFIAILRERAEQRRRERAEKQNTEQSVASSTPHSQASFSSGPSGVGRASMMTPPVDQSAGMRGGGPMFNDEPQDMDWSGMSHMIQSYQSPASFQNFGGGFGPPMGGPPDFGGPRIF